MTDTFNIKIYQVDSELDEHEIRYADSSDMKRYYFDRRDLLKIYAKVYDDYIHFNYSDFEEIIAKLIEDVASNHLVGYTGSSELNISDVIIIDDIHYFYIDSDGATRL